MAIKGQPRQNYAYYAFMRCHPHASFFTSAAYLYGGAGLALLIGFVAKPKIAIDTGLEPFVRAYALGFILLISRVDEFAPLPISGNILP